MGALHVSGACGQSFWDDREFQPVAAGMERGSRTIAPSNKQRNDGTAPQLLANIRRFL